MGLLGVGGGRAPGPTQLVPTRADLVVFGLYTKVLSNISFEERLLGLEKS